MTEDEELKYLWDIRHSVLYRAELSALYHRKRERFFALFDRCGKALALIAGTAAFSSLLATAEQKSWAGLAVAIVTLPGLVMGWADKARLHSDLAQKFTQIQADIDEAGERDFTEEMLNDWKAKIRRLEVSEPPTLSGLVQLCQNQLALAVGDTAAVDPMHWIKRAFVHFFDMPKQLPKE